jgi:hypothetical protein
VGLVPPDSLDLSLSASSPVLDDILLRGPLLSTESPLTRSDLSLSFPEAHRLVTGVSAPSASVVPTSGPDPGTSAEDDCSPTPAFLKENSALDPLQVHHAISASAMTTLVLPPRSPPLPSVTDLDVTIVGCSLREPNAKHTRDHPHDLMHLPTLMHNKVLGSRYHYLMLFLVFSIYTVLLHGTNIKTCNSRGVERTLLPEMSRTTDPCAPFRLTRARVIPTSRLVKTNLLSMLA